MVFFRVRFPTRVQNLRRSRARALHIYIYIYMIRKRTRPARTKRIQGVTIAEIREANNSSETVHQRRAVLRIGTARRFGIETDSR